MSTDLTFSDPPISGPPFILTFGGGGGPPPSGDATIRGAVAVEDVVASGVVSIATKITGVTTLEDIAVTGALNYVSNAARPTVAHVASTWQVAVPVETGPESTWQEANVVFASATSGWQDAAALQIDQTTTWQEAVGLRHSRATAWSDADGVRTDRTTAWQDGIYTRTSRSNRWQDGVPRRNGRSMRWQQALQRRNSTAARWQEGVAQSKPLVVKFAYALPISKAWTALYQEAMRPPHGVHPAEPPTPHEPCYTPPVGNAVSLLFSERWVLTTDLHFYCENHPPIPPTPATVVVPVKDFYLVLNSATLTNVSTGDVIPTLSMSMSLDVDSWTWTLNASVPGAALASVEPAGGAPVEVDARVNGVHYRFFIEGISRDRTWAKSALSLTGRGKTAALDAPYAPTMNFTNTADRTAQQLIADVLTDNGVPMDWAVTWAPEDWTVPAGVFSYQGTYIGAINQIAAAAGAYVQPHNTDQAFSVLLRYPVAPWDWAAAAPDFELPSAVTQRESITWENKPVYNRVFVSGQQQGVLGQVTRAGTAGDTVADTVTDALITAAAAARQRALPVLANTGRIATVGIRLPVLSATGIIKPGALVRYTDGGVTRLGLSRSVTVEIGNPTIWQTVSLETHE